MKATRSANPVNPKIMGIGVQTIFTAALALAITFTLSCSPGGDNGDGNSGGCPNAVTGDGNVSCGGQTYKTVVIGTQTWMAENLNYNASGSKCYDNDPVNCATYGRLYNWATAMTLPSNCKDNSCASQIRAKHRGICPEGWHIPSDEEWDKLYRYVDGSTGTDNPYDSPTAGRELKATSGWENGSDGTTGNGTDAFDFSALPGGYCDSNGWFDYVGLRGYWWSSAEYNANFAYNRYMIYYYKNAYYSYELKSGSRSVRCVRD